MTDYNTLADQVEALLEPCREMDWQIFCIHQSDRLPYFEERMAKTREEAEANGTWAVRPNVIIQCERDMFCPRYTRSLDAAMQLWPLEKMTIGALATSINTAVSKCWGSGCSLIDDLPRFITAAALRAHKEQTDANRSTQRGVAADIRLDRSHRS
tara:strand:+ start:6433 stop:6897 length:465 start_codon:yes stop_codon:yes gene_type:complete